MHKISKKDIGKLNKKIKGLVKCYNMLTIWLKKILNKYLVRIVNLKVIKLIIILPNIWII